MSNVTVTMEFLLLRFSDNHEFQMVHSTSFLVVYLAALVGNSLIVALVVAECHLHKPMYFFLLNLSLADIGLVSVTLPKSIFNSLFNTRQITYSGCVGQVFCLILFMATDFALLTIMAYDRYVAICDPLHYETVMSKEACIQMGAMAWIVPLVYAMLHTIGTFTMPFCSNVINQFFCEIPQLLKIACLDKHHIEMGVHALGALLSFASFVFIISSYVQIFRAVLRIPSTKGRKKTFSTCTPHLLVVSLFLLTTSFSYLKPTTNSPTKLNLAAAVTYSVLPPLMNPIIYSLRNKPIKTAMRKCFRLHWPIFRNL